MNVPLAEIYNIYFKCYSGRKWEEEEEKKSSESQETIEKAVNILTIKYCKSLIIHLQLFDSLQNVQLYRLIKAQKRENQLLKSDRTFFTCAWQFLIQVQFKVILITTPYLLSKIMNKDFGER